MLPDPKSRTDTVIGWLKTVSEAAQAFEQRWTLAALRRTNPDLHGRLREQRNLFDQMLVTGSLAEVERHGAATCRGWMAAVQAMESAEEPDNAFMIGEDAKTGFRVAIGHQMAAATRIADACFCTPDEIAAILGSSEVFRLAAEVKRRFPGAIVSNVKAAADVS
jgi:hypothetical protein